MSNGNFTEEDIRNALSGLSEQDQIVFLEALIKRNNANVEQNKNNTVGDAQNVNSGDTPVVEEIHVDNMDAPIRPQQSIGKNSRFFSLVKSFAPNFSKNFENKIVDGVSYLQKTSVNGIAASEEIMGGEKYQSFMGGLKEKAFNLGVSVSTLKRKWFSPVTQQEEAVNVVKLSGDVAAVNEVQESLEALPQQENVALKTPSKVAKLIDKKTYVGEFIQSHTSKYNYEYSSDDGSLIFNSLNDANSNLKFDYLRVNFLPELKKELSEKMKFYDYVSRHDGKYVKMVDKYAKSVGLKVDDVIDLLNSDAEGDNLPESNLRQAMIIYRNNILKEDVDKRNNLTKTSVELEYLLNVSEKSVNYLASIDQSKLADSRRNLIQNTASNFLNSKIGENNIQELINRQNKNPVNPVIASNLNNSQPEFKVSTVSRLLAQSDVAIANINKSIEKFGQEIDLLYSQKDEIDANIKRVLKIKDPTEEEKIEIAKVKQESREFFTRFDATYQGFAEEFNELKAELGSSIGQIRAMKKTIPPENKLGKIGYMWESRKIQEFNDGLIKGASPVVAHVFNNVGALAKIEEQMLNKLILQSSDKFHAFDTIKENLRNLSLAHVSEAEREKMAKYGDAYTVVSAYQDLGKSLERLINIKEEAEKDFSKQEKNIKKIEVSDLGTYKERYLQNTSTSIKNTCAKFESNKEACLEDVQIKFDAFKRLFNNDAQAINYMKKLATTEKSFSIDSWVNSDKPLAGFAEILETIKSSTLNDMSERKSALLERRESVVLAHYNKLVEANAVEKSEKTAQVISNRQEAISNIASIEQPVEKPVSANDNPTSVGDDEPKKPKARRPRKPKEVKVEATSTPAKSGDCIFDELGVSSDDKQKPEKAPKQVKPSVALADKVQQFEAKGAAEVDIGALGRVKPGRGKS